MFVFKCEKLRERFWCIFKLEVYFLGKPQHIQGKHSSPGVYCEFDAVCFIKWGKRYVFFITQYLLESSKSFIRYTILKIISSELSTTLFMQYLKIMVCFGNLKLSLKLFPLRYRPHQPMPYEWFFKCHVEPLVPKTIIGHYREINY